MGKKGAFAGFPGSKLARSQPAQPAPRRQRVERRRALQGKFPGSVPPLHGQSKVSRSPTDAPLTALSASTRWRQRRARRQARSGWGTPLGNASISMRGWTPAPVGPHPGGPLLRPVRLRGAAHFSPSRLFVPSQRLLGFSN